MHRRIEILHCICFEGMGKVPYEYLTTLGEQGGNATLTAMVGGNASCVMRGHGELSQHISIEVFPSYKAPDEPLYNKQVRRRLLDA